MAPKVDRLTRINELLKREIAEQLERSALPATGMLVSVTEVRTSVDLRHAAVGISIFGGTGAQRGNVWRELAARRADIQAHIGRNLGFKHTPVLEFELDRRQELGDKVLELLNQHEEENNSR